MTTKKATLLDYVHVRKILIDAEEKHFEFINKILLGDCLNVLPKLPSHTVNTVLTDPPFFVPTQHYTSRQNWGKKYSDLSVMKGFFDRVFKEFERVLIKNGHLLVFCDPVSYPLLFQAAYSLFDYTRCLVWYKGKNYFSLGKGAWRYSFELILHSRNSSAYYLQLDRQDMIESRIVPNQERKHPAQKPVALLKKLLKACTPKKGLVLDAFAGSGSTLVACKELGLDYVGIELDKEYWKMTCKRVANVKTLETVGLNHD